jgi:hypothetical protein
MASWWAQYITRRSRQLGLDPRAVLSVAAQEGLSGRVGDVGTSFGPFQLHRGGALPAGRGRAWAESPAGIDYALRQIAGVARGLRGRSAVANIVSRFERPANVPREIAGALASYGSGAALRSGGGAGLGGGGAGLGVGGYPSASLVGPSPGAIAGLQRQRVGARQALGQALIAASQASSRDMPVDYSTLLAAVRANRQAQTAQLPASRIAFGPMPAAGARAGGAGGRGGKGIEELFYDPLGAIKNGKPIPAIGGHRDHVHFASDSPQQMLTAIRAAQRLGLHVSENDFVGQVHPVHVSHSNHYKVIGAYGGRQISGAVDAAGTPAQMAAYYRWVKRNL